MQPGTDKWDSPSNFDFLEAWGLMSPEEQAEIPAAFREACQRRVNALAGAIGKNGHDTLATPKRNMVNWRELAKREPPPFKWLWDHWLSWHPTGLWGLGGMGKSLIAQQLETSLALGRPLWGSSQGPVNVLAWHCEDDDEEIWRRQDRICKRLGVGFDKVWDKLSVDARVGMENAIFTTEFGRPMWTPLYGELQQQVNDYRADVLVLDNIAQIFGGNLNDQHHVTTFVNGIFGLVRGRPFCPIFVGHVAKNKGSEFAGNMAWENAVRMRWYMAEKLPGEAGADQTELETEVTTDTRFFCKRKTNYSVKDYAQFKYEDGVFVLAGDDPSTGGMMDHLRAQRAKTVTLAAVRKLADMGIACSDSKGSNYLPSKVVEMKLGEGFSKYELRAAMNALMVAGELVRAEVGRYAKGSPKFGLTLPPKT